MLLRHTFTLRASSIPNRRKATNSTAPCRCHLPLKPSLTRSTLFQNMEQFKSRNLKTNPSRSTTALVEARVRNPDMVITDEEDPDAEPPRAFWRAMSAFMYIVPWIDIVALGREVYHMFPPTIYLYFLSAPLFGIYYCSQFAPLIVFFLMFLAVVKNTKLSHFVRFHCMQAIMLDIAVMLITILHMYLPAEFRWSWVLPMFDMTAWIWSMTTILYCMFFALQGAYADIPFISEAVYIQVELSEYT